LSDEILVQAVGSLPAAQRLVVVLFRGLRLSWSEIAEVTESSLAETKHDCAEGLLAIHRFITAPEKDSDRYGGPKTGDFK
jgi:DNA-directed RNA polymerase specialized sigma24 family protein